jgi:hypothetical protein
MVNDALIAVVIGYVVGFVCALFTFRRDGKTDRHRHHRRLRRLRRGPLRPLRG